MKTDRWILLATGALLLVVGGYLVFHTSSLSRVTATATFSKSELAPHMNRLTVEAPFGYHVIRYDVVPRSRSGQADQSPFKVGGKSLNGNPTGLYDVDTTHSTTFPPMGAMDDIPVETHVLISSQLNLAATAELPEDRRILDRCGTYLFITKDPDTYERLESIVESWTIDP